MKRRALLVALGMAVAGGSVALATSAAAPRALVEIWGLEDGDEVEIDDDLQTIKLAGPRPFDGAATPGTAPLARELPLGKHVLVVHQKSCAPRAMTVELSTSAKRTIVIQPPTERCALPAIPPRLGS
jgi:hypothetical protein